MNEQVVDYASPEYGSPEKNLLISPKALAQEALYQYADQVAVKVEEEKTALRGASLTATFPDELEQDVVVLLEQHYLTIAGNLARDEAVAQAARLRKNQLEALEERKKTLPSAVRQLVTELRQASRKPSGDRVYIAQLLPADKSPTTIATQADINTKWLAVQTSKINRVSSRTDKQQYLTDCLELDKSLGELLEQYYNNPKLKRPTKINWLLESSKAVTRRQFLAATGAAAAALAVAPYIPKAATAGGAVLARPEIEIDMAEDKKNPAAIENVYKEVEPLYEEFFSECRDLIPLDAWEKIGNRMILYAQMYYLTNKETGSFKEYYLNFMHQAHKFSQDIGLHPLLMFRTLAESVGHYEMGGVKIWTKSYRNDRLVGQAQAIGKTLAVEAPDLAEEMAKLVVASDDSFRARLGKFLSNKLPMSYFDLVRFFGPITMGINDMEVEIMANGIAYCPAGQQKEFRERFPEAARSFTALRQQRQGVERARGEMRKACEAFVKDNEMMKIFFEDSTAKLALADIGIDEDKLDEQLLRKPTACWLNVLGRPIDDISDRNKSVVNRTIEYYQQQYDQNGYEAAAMTLMSQQLMANDKLVKWLENNTGIKKLPLVAAIMETRAQYTAAVKRMAYNELAADRDAGKLEFNKDFQLMTGIATFKYLAEEAAKEFGSPDMKVPDSVSFYNLAMLVNRIMVNNEVLINGSIFCRSEIVDPVYDNKANLSGFRTFINQMIETGLIDKSPWEEGGYEQFKQAVMDIESFNPAEKKYDEEREDKIKAIRPYYRQWEPFPMFLTSVLACASEQI